MAQKSANFKVETKPLYVPPLQDVVQALQKGLSSYFKYVNVSAVDCPDLTAQPFSMAFPGLCGSPRVVEIGGVSNFIPLYNPEKVYDLRLLGGLVGIEPVAVAGTGLGPFLNGHDCSELLVNAYISKEKVHSLNRIAKVNEKIDRGYTVEFLPKDETRFVMMANIFLSNGKPGKVLKIHCKNRINNYDFPAAVRKCLEDKFIGKHLGLGGVFLVEGSRVRQHLPPAKFSSEPITTPEQLNLWLRFFDMNPPLVFLGTILTDNMDMEMILQHFHSLSDHGEAGHYHHDVSPTSVEYLAYFSLCEAAVHVDRPPRTSALLVDNIKPTNS